MQKKLNKNNINSVVFYYGKKEKKFLETADNIGTLEYVIEATRWAIKNEKNGWIEVVEKGRAIYQTIIDYYEINRRKKTETMGKLERGGKKKDGRKKS